MPDDAIERALKVLELANAIRIECVDPKGDRFYVIDTSKAEPEVNWPGENLSQIVKFDEAKEIRNRAQATVLLAFASQQAPEGWRLIETAPKDGEPILIWKPDERMVGEYMMAAYWTDDHHSGEPGFVPVGGHHKLGYLSRVTGTPQGYPTHWQPLPAPPTMLDAAPSVTLGEVG